MKIGFTGTIETTDLGVILSGLREWLGAAELEVRAKLSGEQISYEDFRTELFCYRSVSADGTGPEFIVEGTIADTGEDALAFLSTLRAAFAKRSVNAEIDYNEIDDDGKATGESFSVD
jgi:hypothetical protein